ncbi:MAG: hypothetical protein KatS3mg074_147 [Meiothermus sp.]|uniref:Uncharacterized protein n=2 Tax=Meiothermus hypogaeus TaxID=884155 RepID=A0A511R0Y2_9DEIN|nr:hypothetical protein [Meiothermus hypogaeus]RIH80764.1 hypothetical protein Mhypo_00274 [Meiothermus hypogaeus]GEM83290.1 hypothetical protein MHY01S_14560 [Meiothermus hypogaeus NBRC 106114]GIW37749.1 MAG: hypothetical protein KatS3mg074_147 [Meiothermus sp.]
MYETLEGSVLQAQIASIHGAVFYDVVLQAGDTVRRLRFQDTFLNPAPEPGEYLKIELILGNVSNVQRIPAP